MGAVKNGKKLGKSYAGGWFEGQRSLVTLRAEQIVTNCGGFKHFSIIIYGIIILRMSSFPSTNISNMFQDG